MMPSILGSKKILLWVSEEDKQFIPTFRALFAGHATMIRTAPVNTFYEVMSHCSTNNITAVITNNLTLLRKLAGDEKAKLGNYAGSYFIREGIEFVIIPELMQSVTLNYGRFLIERFITKITRPDSWIPTSTFRYTLATASNLDELYDVCSSAVLLACDIETLKDPLSIRCIGYTAVQQDLSCTSFVIPIDSLANLAWMRKINDLPVPKVFQNGKYDCAYLARYNAVPRNYMLDTITMAHCWYVELPKDLAFTTMFLVKDAWYWKDMADSLDLQTYYQYCARDTWGTAWAAISWLLSAPQWAKNNYLMEFPTVFPAHLCEMTGLAVDMPAFTAAKQEIAVRIAAKTASLNAMLGIQPPQTFNVNSYPQMKSLFKILGCGDLPGQDEKQIGKAKFRHPLNARILDLVLDIRGDRKLLSTYLVEDKIFEGRILYSLNPHGTDSGRFASSEHHFWCGLQIQNIPRGPEVKQALCADTGFVLYEVDLEQAESRDTAFAAGDEKLIAAVTGSRDFHSVNASAFFGKSYEDIYDSVKNKTKDKPLRDLAKRVNHGANYCMGEAVLVDTMGLENIYKAARALGFSKLWTPLQIAAELLAIFHRTYPHLAGVYYPWIWAQVKKSKLLVGATGWTRYCFGNIDKNKRDRNSYVAHVAQSLNAMTLNKAFIRIFYEVWLPNQQHFKLHAQIHDSVLFSVASGHEHLALQVKELMEIPVTITGADSKTRTFTVPAAIKGPGTHWSKLE
jgi:DNA polymerase I-like protein with 3'-5' exonuclease and polymerase domains